MKGSWFSAPGVLLLSRLHCHPSPPTSPQRQHQTFSPNDDSTDAGADADETP